MCLSQTDRAHSYLCTRAHRKWTTTIGILFKKESNANGSHYSSRILCECDSDPIMVEECKCIQRPMGLQKFLDLERALRCVCRTHNKGKFIHCATTYHKSAIDIIVLSFYYLGLHTKELTISQISHSIKRIITTTKDIMIIQ